jgi:NAD(P)H-dependent flavin oxidoreductase YrpB (nitropropane dioxygenase family)
MHTALCDELGIEFPIFAFTHCRDVVVAVSKAGGFGVLGAVGFTPEQLEIELNWIDEHIGDHPYGVDIVIPNKYEGMDANMSADELKAMLQSLVPQEHLDFAKKILKDHGVPTDDSDDNALQLLGWTEATATPQVEIALRHPKMTLIANALGTPPVDMIKNIHDAGRKVAALCGSPSQARKHADAGVDIIIAQGGEAGGHSGEVGSIVLWPQVVKEVAPVPVLAAGGIGSGQQIAAALALGTAGAWTGSPWLLVEAAENTPVQQAAQPLVHRKACAHAAQRLDRSLGDAGQSRAARNAVAVHGVRHGGRRHPQVPERDGRRGVQPGRPGGRPVHEGREDLGGDRALGAGVPRGHRHAQRAQRGCRGLSVRHAPAFQGRRQHPG